jgi:hypothetical protein
MPNTIEKVDSKPIEAVILSHHRNLPPGKYEVLMHDDNARLHVIRDVFSGVMCLVDWVGPVGMLEWFEVRENGDIGSASSSTTQKRKRRQERRGF